MPDPYTPPPRHRERSGALVRFAIIGILLAGAAWGYMAYSNSPQLTAEAPAEEQMLADSSFDAAPPPAVETPAPQEATTSPAPAERAPTAPTSASPEPPPPPSTTIGEPPSGR